MSKIKQKTVEQQFRKLSEIEHVLKRPGRYLGAIEVSPEYTYLIENDQVVWREVNYSPAFLKLFDEIISNSADFSKTPEGKHVNKIDVTIDQSTGIISVRDNGGIPVVKHKEYDQYIPDLIFGELRTGTNFDDEDDSVSTGQNGEGGKICNIYSTEFIVDTSDGKKQFYCKYFNNMNDNDGIKISKSSSKHTQITYRPDYTRLGMELDADHLTMLIRRSYEIAAINPHLTVSVNGIALKIKSFKDFTSLFSENKIDFGNNRFQASVFHSGHGFKQIGFVNSTNVSQGGTHVDALMSQIVTSVRDYVKKKTKQDVKPSDIKNHFFLISNSTINNPRYDSQTKELLITPVKDYGMSIEIDDKTLQKIIKSDIVEEIILWAENKAALDELAALRKKNKNLDKSGKSLRDIEKYEPATSKNRSKCSLFIAEGLSAGSVLQSARNPEFHGIYPLKGKPLNVRGMKVKDLIANKELEDLMKIIGLQFGKDHFISDLRYNELIICTDADLDGHHISALLYNLFNELWPSLLKQGFIFKLQTPIVRVTQSKKEIDFMNLTKFHEWEKKQTKPYSTSYLKGLGSNDTKYFKEYMYKSEYKIPVIVKNEEDIEALDIAFDKSKADIRKKFIYGDIQ